MKKIDYDKWHDGPPPSPGWWPASSAKNDKLLRWWDGRCWSAFAWVSCTAKEADWLSKIKVPTPNNIQWRHRPKNWPVRSLT